MGVPRVTWGYIGLHGATQDCIRHYAKLHGSTQGFHSKLYIVPTLHEGLQQHGYMGLYTQGYIRLHKVTYGYTGLHKATKGWHGATHCYVVLQRVT